ncbi:MAG: PilT/PilU family type 4a pilus ATPase [Candidatus Omnitrophota bacterium]|jgi:twitching motility protein PilT|nr:PilT/PilU family type 4a pilus ATPase [Candidatus Omnitrophota bacterium]MDD3982489.1 PilT/PilU family type 4a pilus ATPase [Candidatus Omnitrophota bacterium]MDD5526365.1 PilT/PilU family type 4a pilus ATPase [Candidatus Omnitrophota bacterium]
MTNIKNYLKMMLDRNASDMFFRAGSNVRLRIDGEVVSIDERVITLDEVNEAVKELTSNELKDFFQRTLDVDFGVYVPELDNRFRISIFMQRNWPALVVRSIRSAIQTFEELHLPSDILSRLSMEKRGLILLTGSVGSGKSTTIASMIEYVNNNANKHILTVEEPIEFTFKDKRSIINQRELGIDVSSYAVALRAFTLQSPDVIFIGNIRDYETMSAALTAAETGVLVFSTLHTVNAPQTLERIVNFFPPHQHAEVRTQLSYLLKGVISLRLLPSKEGKGRLPAYETMLQTPTISRLLREGKTWEIPQFVDDGAVYGMQSFSQALVKLVREGKITEETALMFCDNKDEFMLALRGICRG